MENPLISIVVITYNSAKFIIETLDSIYNQTYNNIELIITDDCSKDNTIEICEQWLLTHKERFFKTQIIISRINTGIPANCNRGYNASSGEWIKAIAGDDCLYPNALEKYISTAINYKASLLFSSIDIYIKNFNPINKVNSHISPPILFKSNRATAKEQFEMLTFGNQIFAPAVIMKKNLYQNVNKYDENIKLCEDWPMWLKLTRYGYKFHYINEPLVKYRQYNDSTWGKQSIGKQYVVINGENLIKNKYIYPYVNIFDEIILRLEYCIRKKFNKSNCKNFFFDLIYGMCSRYMNYKKNILCQKYQ